jgi:hypothetical protein
MTGAQLHMNQLRLKFGSYCQVAEDVTPHNSLAARTRAAISMGPSGNLSGGHRFLALDTGKMIVRNRWKELPMPTAVIDCVYVLGRAECLLLVFTDRQGRTIGDYAPTTVEQADAEEDESVVADLYSSIPPAPDVTPGVSSIEEGSADDIPGVDLADVVVLHEPTGVDMGVPQANTPQVFDDAVFDTDLDGGLDAEPPTLETPADTPPVGMAARNPRVRKPPEKFIPSMQGNKYEIALSQITASLGKSKNSLAFAQMSVKLMNKGEHRRADIVGMVMAQVSLKAALKKWGKEAEESVGKKCRSPDSWPWTDHSQISLIHLPTPPKCSTRAIVALINNLGIVYHQYCSSSYLVYTADPGSLYRSRQWKSSTNLIPTRPPELQSHSRLPTDSVESPKAPSNLNSPSPMLLL